MINKFTLYKKNVLFANKALKHYLILLTIYISLLGGGNKALAQCSLNDYTFATSTGTYVANTSATLLPTVVADEATSTNQAIGFQFFYAGRSYTHFSMNSNGYINLLNGTSQASAGTTFNVPFNTANAPIIAALDSDLKGLGSSTPAGVASYVLSGSAPSRVLTIEWANWLWKFNAASPTISFQIKLYEGSNKIEFVYKPVTFPPTGPASIGLGASSLANTANFISVNGLSTTATASTSVYTSTIQPTTLVSGLTYSFTPPTSPITITQQPITTKLFVPTDPPITISTSATATGTVSYQWQQSIDNGVTWTNVVNNTTFSNATTSSLTITNPATTVNNYLYRCSVSSSGNSCPVFTNYFKLTVYQGYTVINNVGGVGASTTDLRVAIGYGGQMQIKKNGSGQLYAPAVEPAATSVTTLNNGIFLTIGNKVYGPANSRTSAAIPYTIVYHGGGSESGSGNDLLIMKAVDGTLEYLITVTYTYIYPNSFVNIKYKVDIPAGNTKQVKLYHAMDTYCGGSDSGPAFIQGVAPNIMVGVKVSPVFEAFRYVSGLNWTGYYSAVYTDMYNNYLLTQANYTNTLNFNSVDNGIAWNIDFGPSSAAGSYETSSDVVFDFPTQPTVSSNPVNKTTCANAAVTFSASSTDPNILYKWEVSTDSGVTFSTITDNATYSGATTGTLSVNAVSTMNNYQYRCLLYLPPGWNAIYTTAATLTVPQPSAAAPIVSLNNTNFCSSGNYTLTVANAVPGATYLWKKDGVVITGATGPTLSTNSTGTYLVINTTSTPCSSDSSAPVVVNSVDCTDSDGDGIPDIIDIDDDNDGVLDTVENLCVNSVVSKTGIVVTKPLTINYTFNGTNTISNLVDGQDSATANVISIPTGTLNNSLLLQIELPTAKELSYLEIGHSSGQTLFTTATTYKIQASNDGTTWFDVTGTLTYNNAAVSTTNGLATFNSNIVNIPQTGIAYKFYRLYGISAASGGGWATELYIKEYACTILDKDSDGKLNRLDLDSDGDGCSDAYESGNTTSTASNFTHSAPYGANGFADALETTSESGIYKGFYYYNYALSNTIKLCADFDNDGILDIVDLDDDNDGVLDHIESPSCYYTVNDWNTNDKSYLVLSSSDLITSAPNNNLPGLTDGVGDVSVVQFSTTTAQSQLNKEIFKFAFNTPTQLDAIYIKKESTTQIFASTASSLMVQGSNDNTAWTNLLTAPIASPLDATNVTANGSISIPNSNKFSITANAAKYKFYRIYGVVAANILAGKATEVYFDVNTTDYIASSYPKNACLSDTDNDTFSNHQDLDSDGDGCSDAVESGVTLITTSGISTTNQFTASTIPSPYGSNGFADGLESSVENGKYKGVYTYDYATNSNYIFCKDTDNDGISDYFDIDDDNDGVLDEEECNGQIFTSLKEEISYKSKMIGASFHGTIFRANDGNYYVVGVGASSAGTDIVSPVKVIPANGYNFTGKIIDIAALGFSTSFVLATTDGIWVWGNTSINLNLPGVSGSAFQKVNLPASINPSEIASISVATNNFMILMKDGTVYAHSKDAYNNNGSGQTAITPSFTKVLTSVNSSLTGITHILATPFGSFAANSTSNTLYTWGSNVFIGDGSAKTILNYATQMVNPLPSGVSIVWLQGTNTIDGMTYFLLGSDRKVYTLGAGTAGILGVGSNLALTTWANVKGENGVGILENVDYLSSQNATYNTYPTASVVLTSGRVLSWGSGNSSMLGLGASDTNVPKFPSGVSPSDVIYVVENGGHITTLLNTNGKIGNVGHNFSGAFGDGTTTDRTIYEFRDFIGSNSNDSSSRLDYTCEPDIDGDGIANRLDLDSDGDGCSDAIEAGSSTTATSTTVFPLGTDTNANGLLNSYEGTTDGTINYVSTYKNYALSKAINTCSDTDNDGVNDLVDIDDDNDGVLDATESPTCFFNASEWNLTDKNFYVKFTSQLNTVSPNTNFSALGDNIGGTIEAIQFDTTQNQLNKEIFKFEFFRPIALDAIYIAKVSANQIFANTASSLMLQGSNDNSSWTNLLPSPINSPTNATNITINGSVSIPNSNMFSVLTNAGSYKYYRIYGVASSNILNGIASEVFFDVNNNLYQPSQMPKSVCNNDIDNDNKANHLDIDSDGDGCSDAVEAGTTTDFTANYTHPAPYGVNGFANALETSTESGQYKNNYTYNYAIFNTIKACSDFDSDGILDIVDLDDDNDGVLDHVESPSCFVAVNEWNTIDKSDYATITSGLNTLNPNTNFAGLLDNTQLDAVQFSTATAQSQLNKEIFKIAFTGATQLDALYIKKSSATQIFGANVMLQGSNNNSTWNDLMSAAANPANATNVTVNGAVSLSNSVKFAVNINAASYKYYRIYGTVAGNILAGIAQEFYFDVNSAKYNPSIFPKIEACTEDKDADGKLNHLDLDSDGDGCSDAYEAGTTTLLTANYVHPAPYGSNGFANALETVAESGVYKNTYTYDYATSSVIKTCTDTDGDGVIDIVDLDDDNDGVLDVVECPQLSKYKVYAYNRPDINFATNLPVIVSGLFSQTYSLDQRTQGVAPNNFTYNGLSTWKLVATDIIPSTQNTISVKFAPNTSTGGTYTSADAILITNGVDTYVIDDRSAVAGEFVLTGTWTQQTTPPSYNNNTNTYFTAPYTSLPTATWNFKTVACTLDTDGDNTLNYLDLDSDGDNCSDAFEAGTTTITTANYVHPSPYGANGFADALETVAESGVYKNTYTYKNAIKNTILACVDSDNDGIFDIIDIDDDNDGVLDTTEMTSCNNQLITPLSATTSTAATGTSSLSTYNSSGLSANTTAGVATAPSTATDSWSTSDGTTSGWIEYSFPVNTNLGSIALWAPDAFNSGGGDGPLKDFTATITYNGGANTVTSAVFTTLKPTGSGSNPQAQIFEFDQVYSNVTKIKLNITSGWVDVSDNNFTYKGTNETTAATNYNIVLSEFRAVCSNVDIDTDSDGIPNRLDLDSDGDGCSDANETGATKLTTANYTFLSPYGANGLADSLETVAENGIINYKSNYSNAKLTTINYCSDNDGDGVNNYDDIDDDNDGVLDATESPTCFYTAAEAQIISSISSELTSPDDANPNIDIEILRDGNTSVNTFNFNADQPLINMNIFTVAYPTPVNIATLTIVNNVSFGATSSAKVQASNDLSVWTDVSSTTSLATTTDKTFTINTNNNEYKYYKIVGVGAATTVTTTTINEITATYSANYLPSLHPKKACSVDTDNDNIYNHLDPDSDGDGCSDAIESGATTNSLSNYTFAAPYGTNGLADSLETTADSNVINYTQTYSKATDVSVKECVIHDADGDGITDEKEVLDGTDPNNPCSYIVASRTIAPTVDVTIPTANAGTDFTITCVTNPSGKEIGATSTTGVTYAWTPATGLSSATVANPSATPAATTTYTLVTTYTASGCTATDSVVVTVDVTEPSASAGDDFTKTCAVNPSGKQIGMTAVTGNTYSWSSTTGLDNASIANPTANPTDTVTYTLTATNTASGCTKSDTINVTVNNTPPTASAGTNFTISCTQNSSGKEIGMTAIAGNTYSWSPSTGLSSATVANPSATPTVSTQYTLTVTDTDSGCTAVSSIDVTVDKTTPTASAGTDFTKSCTANPSGKTIGMTAETGTTYLWSPATGLSSATVSNPTANPTATTTYTLTATNTASGCTTTDTIDVTVNTTLPTAVAGDDFTISCIENTSGKEIGMTALAGNTYSWSPTTGLSDAAISNPIAEPSVTTTYTLTVTNTASGCTKTDDIVVTVNNTPPTASAGTDFAKTCTTNATGKTIGMTAVTGNTYLWSPATGLDDATKANPFANPTNTTTYTLTVTTTSSGCITTDTIDVTVNNALPTASAGTDFSITCTQNASGKEIGMNPVAGNTYSWSPTTGLSDATISNPVATPTVTTTYTLTVTNTASGCTKTDDIVVTVNNTPPTANAGVDFSKTCVANASGKAIGMTAVTGNTYSWSPTTGLDDASIANPTANPSATTTYTLTVTNTASGCITTDSIDVTVNNSLPTANAGTDFTKTCTDNISGKEIGMSATTGNTYSWSPTTGLSDATISNPVANPTATTTYTLTVTNTASGCTKTDDVVVTVNNTPPTASAGTDFTKNCTTNTTGKSIGMTAVTGNTYSWNPATGLSDAAISNPTANPSATTTYTLTVTNTTSGCTATDSIDVTVNTTVPVADAGADFTKTCASFANGKTIGVASVSGNSYSWSPSTGLSDAAIASPTANPSSTQTYTLTVTNTTSNCTATDTVVVTVDTTKPAKPTISSSGNNVCSGTEVTLTSSATSGNQWYKGGVLIVGATNQTYVTSLAGTFTVTTTNSVGCTSDPSDAQIVTIDQVPTSSISEGATLAFGDCGNSTLTLTAVSNISSPTYQWYKDGVAIAGATAQNYNYNATDVGDYSVKITNNVCSTTSAISKVLGVPTVGTSGSTTVCQGETVALSAASSGFTSNATYQWQVDTGSGFANVSTGGTAKDYSATATGKYRVVVTDGSIVSTSCPIDVTVYTNPTVSISPLSGSYCVGQTATITATPTVTSPATIATYEWYVDTTIISGETATTFSPTETGNYKVRVTDSNGCRATSSVAAITFNSVPVQPVAVVSQPNCTDSLGTITVDSPKGTGLVYSIDGADYTNTTGIFTSLAASTYSLTVKNANGCISPATSIVINSQPTIPVANAGSDFTKNCYNNNLTGATIGTTAVTGNSYSWSPATGLSDSTIANPNANPSATTTYTVTVANDVSGCVRTDSVVVTVEATVPVANAGLDFTKTCTTNSTGKTIGMTAVTGVTYSWSSTSSSNFSTNSSISVNPTATETYTLTATNTASGCSATDSVIVTVNTTVPAADAGTDFTKNCVDNPNGKAIGATAVTGNSYSWSPSTGLSSATDANPTANPLVNTTYNLTVTNDASGCTATDSVIVTVNTTVPTADAGADFTKTCTSNNAGKLIGVASIAGNTYLWDNATGLTSDTAANPTANPSSTQTYNLTVTNTTSKCTATDSVVVTVNTTVPTADAGGDFTKNCVDNPNGKAIGATVVTGNSYSWSPSTGLSSATDANPTANPLVNTTYNLTVTNDASGCTAIDSVVVTVNTTVPTADAGADFTKTCTSNNTGKLIGVASVTGNTYLWDNATGLTSDTAANPTANPGSTQTYNLTVTNTTSKCTATDTVVVTVDVTPAIANAGADFSKTCLINSNGATIGDTSVTGNTYSWSPAIGLSDATISNPTANPIVNTTYDLTVTNLGSGCTATDSIVVSVDKTIPSVNAGADFTKTCTSNISGKLIGAAAVTGVTYAWSPATDLTSATDANPTANPTSTQTYTLTSTQTSSGCTATDTVVVTVNQTYPVADAGSDFAISCLSNPNGATIGINSVAGNTYSWSPATGLSDDTISNPTATPTSNTTYTLTVTNSSSGCESTDTVAVSVDKTIPAASAGADFTITCTSNTLGKQIGMTAVSGVTYAWSPTTSLDDATISNPTATPTANETYTLTATQTSSGCTATDSIAVTVNKTHPTADAGSDFEKTCLVNPDGTNIGVASVTGNSYSWSPTTALSNPLIASPIADPTTTTTYTLTVTYDATGCTTTDTVKVTVNTPVTTADAGTAFTKTCVLNPSGLNIGMDAVTGNTYSWSPATGLSDATISKPIANPTATTTYTLTATNPSSGCSATGTVIVTVDIEVPDVNAGADFIKTCAVYPDGKEVGMIAIPGDSYSWSPTLNVTSPTSSTTIVAPATSTSYVLTATDDTSGCTATDTVDVTVIGFLPNATAGSPFTKTCIDNPEGKDIGTPFEQGVSYSWSPSTGLSSPTISNPNANPDETTTYTLTALNDESGCTVTDTVVVTVNKAVPTAIVGNGFTKDCVQNTDGKLIGSTPNSGLTYKWSPINGLSDANSANPKANPDATTNYTLAVTDDVSGCVATNTIEVLVNKNTPAVNAGSDFVKTCTTNSSGKEIGMVALSGNTYSWTPSNGLTTTVDGNPIANPDATTTYTLTVTDNDSGCTASDSVIVTVDKTTPIVDAGADFTKNCSINPNGKEIGLIGLSGYTYEWSPSTGLSSIIDGNPIANPDISTTYTLKITNNDTGCFATDTIDVTVNKEVSTAFAGSDFKISCNLNANGKEIGSLPVNGNTYSWTPTTGLSDATIANPIAKPIATTTYVLTVTNINSSCTATDSVEVVVDSNLPTVSAGADFTISCNANSNGKEIGMPSQAGYTYSWSPTEGLSNPTIANPIASPNINTNYILTVTNDATGCSASDSINVTVDNSVPIANAGTDFTKTCILNSTGKLIGASAVTGFIYSWSPAEGLSDATIANPTANPTATTTYTLTVTNSITGCKKTDEVIVTVNTQAPVANAGNDFTMSCTENIDGNTIGMTANASNTYSWSPATGLSDATVSNPLAKPLATTTYTLTVTDTVSGCTATDSVIVTVSNVWPTDCDSDQDGVTNAQEIIDGTNPNDPCSLKLSSQTLSTGLAWLNADCDGDGLTNQEEKTGVDNPLTPANPKGKITSPLSKDTDGDGVTDAQEAIDDTDPNNPCVAVAAHVTEPFSPAFLAGDCDGDGMSNGNEFGNLPTKPNDADHDGIPDYLEPSNHASNSEELEVFNSISPNGDNDNDVLTIQGIENFPDNTLTIYNRWGIIVFEADGYGQTPDKVFRGFSEGRQTIQKDVQLPEGTFYYILRYVNGSGQEKQKLGYLYIKN